jgi:PAS domain S-box-containing protein
VPQSNAGRATVPPQLRFLVPLEASHLLRARERLRDYLREYCASSDLIDDVVLCIEEACTNAIRHSGALDDMEIALRFADGTLLALVKDAGRGFDLEGFDPHVAPDPACDHGRGLFIIASFMDELELHCDAGLEVRMAKKALSHCKGDTLESGLGETGGAASHRQTRLRAMLEEIDEGFIGLDWEYRQVHVNETACRMVGRSTDELLGRTPCQVWPELEGSEAERSCRQAMELGRPSTVEHAIGAERWFELRVYPTAIGVSVYLRDVSERKRKEAERDRYLGELRESEARSELLAHVASELLSSDDPQGLIEELCRQVMAHLDCQAFLNFVADSEAGRLHLNAYAGIRDDEARGIEWLDYGARISGLVARDRVRLVIENIGATSDARTDLLASYGLRAFACHPLLAQGRVLGTLAFGTRTRDHFSDDDLSLMATVADHVASATVRADAQREREGLVGRLQRQGEELQVRTAALRAQALELRAQADLARRQTALAGALNTIDGLIHSTHDFDEIMRRALEQGARALGADAGTIEVREGGSWVVHYQYGLSADDVGLCQSEADAPSATRAWATMQPVTVCDLAQDAPLNGGFVRSRGLRSVLAAPLIVRQRVTGCLLFYGRRPREFSEAEIDFVRKLGVTVSLATDNARLYQQEHDVAQVLRAALLKLPDRIAGLRYSHRYHAAVEPAHVGGDFYDLFELDHGLVGVVIGDISGKGIAAAVLTSLVKNTLRAHAAEKGKTPADVVALTNIVLARETAAEVFATVFFAMLDRRDGRLVYCNAGHPAIVVARADGEVAVLPATSPLIGAFTDFTYTNAETALACDDLLFLYTDGLTEARRDQDMFGESRVFEDRKSTRLNSSHEQ